MKVVEIISDKNVGGAGVLLCTRLKYTDPREMETTVLLPRGSALKPRVEGLGRTVRELPPSAKRSWSVPGLLALVAHLRILRPDLVNCHGSLCGRVAAKVCGVPTVLYTRHCVYPLKAWQKSSPGRLLLTVAQNLLCDAAIAVANAAQKNLIDLGVFQEKIHVIINGAEPLRPLSSEEKIRIRESLGIQSEDFVVGICGRLEPCKGHRVLLKAAEKLLKDGKDIHFLIVGEGSQRRALRAQCREAGLLPYVTFTGFAEDVTPYVNVMDLLVNCSVGTETSSLALSEGMSLGIPLVASRYGGNPYLVRQGENGLLYPAGDAVALAKAIRYLKETPSVYEKLSAGAAERFRKELHGKKMTDTTNRLYRSLYLTRGASRRLPRKSTDLIQKCFKRKL